MSGYRCVNYYELCRLCTASHGTKKIHIFSEEGRQKKLLQKISECLPIVVSEHDKLPKIVCTQCLTQVENITKFREASINAQTMLESCLNSSKLRNGGKVYIKDVSPKKPPMSPPQLARTITNSAKAGIPLTIGKTTLTKAPVQKNNSTDFLSSIIQAVGIQNVDDQTETQIIQPQQTHQQQQQQQQQPVQQYTITLDGSTLKTNQIHYKIEPSGAISIQEPFVQQLTTTNTGQQTTLSSNTLAQVDEFLKLKSTNAITSSAVTVTTAGTKRKEQTVQILDTLPGKKQKFNLVLASPVVQTQQPKVQMQGAHLTTANTLVSNAGKTHVSLQDLKFLSNNKCLVPITVKDGSNNEQQTMVQLDTKNLVLPTYVQMKLQPQITTVDGQQVVQLPTSISLSNQQPQIVQSQIQIPQHSQATTLLTTSTGQSITLSQPIQHLSTVETSAGKVQLTTLQNVATPNITHPLPQSSAITLQRIKVENENTMATTSPNTKLVTKQQTYKLATLPTAKANASNASASSASVNVTGKVTTTVRRAPNTKTTTTTTAATKTITVPITQSSANTNRANNTNTTIAGDQNDRPKTDVPTCEICEKVFKRKEHLAQHMKLHLGLRPFKCEEPNCNKAFSRKEHLMRHCVSHTGKKQFDCEYCHKLFSRKDNLNKHKRSHEQKQQEQTIVYTVTEVN